MLNMMNMKMKMNVKKIYSIYDKLMDEGPLVFDTIQNVFCLYYEIPYSINDELDFLGLISANNSTILDYRFKTFNSGKKTKYLLNVLLSYIQENQKKY